MRRLQLGDAVFEILGRRRNLDFRNNESQEWFPIWVWERYEQGQLQSVASVYGIKDRDREKAERICQVALWCVQYKPEMRPEMGMVVRMLEGEEEIMKSPNPFEHMALRDAYFSSSTDSVTTSTTKLSSLTRLPIYLGGRRSAAVN
ncbi:hypothetical protein HPP92_017417 [Vanilla planifolia]|uniref:Uncharacterized protein n=1 Tax=Vanilla planifolia TaxID=51239 RepID=A0A835QKU7_VANPL|nr:hypothetical protein HPP92_017417 [Vanilla planifolia]